MKDPKRQLQTAYFGILSDALDVSVYDFVPSDPSYPYVKIGEYTEVDYSDKTRFGEDLTIIIQVVDRSGASGGSRLALYDIVAKVKSAIRARPVPFDLGDFNVITSTVDNETTFRELTDTHLYYNTNIRFRHLIEQNGDNNE